LQGCKPLAALWVMNRLCRLPVVEVVVRHIRQNPDLIELLNAHFIVLMADQLGNDGLAADKSSAFSGKQRPTNYKHDRMEDRLDELYDRMASNYWNFLLALILRFS
jgi:hypothetical protein